MAEKAVTKKLLVVLVIMLALSIVVDFLFLNTLYDINKGGTKGLKGALASAWSDCALDAEIDKDTEFLDLTNEYKQKYEVIYSSNTGTDDEYNELIKWYEEELRRITNKYNIDMEACGAGF
jgi:hypothetical protein